MQLSSAKIVSSATKIARRHGNCCHRPAARNCSGLDHPPGLGRLFRPRTRGLGLLFARQTEMLKGRASEAFRQGVEHLRLSDKGIPNFEELSERLSQPHRLAGGGGAGSGAG